MKPTSDEAYAQYQERKRTNPEYKVKACERTAEWIKNNQETRTAHKAVRSALGKGLLIKPYFCDDCGKQAKVIDGHHDDYTKLLEVRWLCRSCHILAHNPNKKPPKWGRTPRAASPQEK